jgi:hypothetical protein
VTSSVWWCIFLMMPTCCIVITKRCISAPAVIPLYIRVLSLLRLFQENSVCLFLKWYWYSPFIDHYCSLSDGFILWK